MTERGYSHEFKCEAVQLVAERGLSVTKAARELNLRTTVLRGWVRKYGLSSTGMFSREGRMKFEVEELLRLQREITQLKAECEILRKVAIRFAGYQL